VLCLEAVFFAGLWERIERGYPDFSVFYTAATILRVGLGHQLYRPQVQNRIQKGFTGELPSRPSALPYIHPPFEALFFLPFSRLSFRQAFLAWDSLNLAMLFLIGLLLRGNVGIVRWLPAGEFVPWVLAFFPVFECLLQGQDSILQLLFCVLAWKALKKDADVLAGCWFALGAFKFQIMLPLVVLVCFWRRRRALVGFTAVGLGLAAISIGLVGWRGLLEYPVFAMRVANTPGMGGVPVDFLPNLHGLIMGWPLKLTGSVGTVAVLFSSAILFLFAAARERSLSLQRRSDLCFAMAIAVSELIGWQTNIHDFSLLVLPVILVADFCLNRSSPKLSDRWKLLYPVLPLLISPLWFALWLSIGQVNLIAISLLWWVWKISQELAGSGVRGGVQSAIAI